MLHISLLESDKISEASTNEINLLAASGFGREPHTLIEDTIDHIKEADYIQMCRNERNELIAFAMYRRCLWR